MRRDDVTDTKEKMGIEKNRKETKFASLLAYEIAQPQKNTADSYHNLNNHCRPLSSNVLQLLGNPQARSNKQEDGAQDAKEPGEAAVLAWNLDIHSKQTAN